MDPSEGFAYISLDMVFDEHDFPFSQLHPDTGARLRAELSICPNVLLNPSSSFGDAILHDRQGSDFTPTNGVPSASDSIFATGENMANSSEDLRLDRRYFMCS